MDVRQIRSSLGAFAALRADGTAARLPHKVQLCAMSQSTCTMAYCVLRIDFCPEVVSWGHAHYGVSDFIQYKHSYHSYLA